MELTEQEFAKMVRTNKSTIYTVCYLYTSKSRARISEPPNPQVYHGDGSEPKVGGAKRKVKSSPYILC